MLASVVRVKVGANLFSADRKWVPAIKVLAAIEDRHLPIENLLLISFYHRLHNFSTKNATMTHSY